MLCSIVGREGLKAQDCWQTAVAKEEMDAKGEYYAEFTLLSGTGDTCFGIVPFGLNPDETDETVRARSTFSAGWMYHCKRSCLVHGGQDTPLVSILSYLCAAPSTYILETETSAYHTMLVRSIFAAYKYNILIHYASICNGSSLCLQESVRGCKASASQFSRSGRKVGANQPVGLLLRKGDLIAYRNSKPLGLLCRGLKGTFVWAAGMYDTGSSARIERKPLPREFEAS